MPSGVPQGPLDVPSGCLLSGLEASVSPCVRQLALSSDIIIQGHRIELGELKLNVYTVVGVHDDLQVKQPAAGCHGNAMPQKAQTKVVLFYLVLWVFFSV